MSLNSLWTIISQIFVHYFGQSSKSLRDYLKSLGQAPQVIRLLRMPLKLAGTSSVKWGDNGSMSAPYYVYLNIDCRSLQVCAMRNMSRHNMLAGGYQNHFFLTFLVTRKTCLGMSPRHVTKTLLRGVFRRHVNVVTHDMSSAMSLYSSRNAM